MSMNDRDEPHGRGMGEQRGASSADDVEREEIGERSDTQALGASRASRASDAAETVDEDELDTVEEASEESFPASDAPSWLIRHL